MKRFLLPAVVALPLMIIGCGSSPESVANDVTAAFKKVGTIIDGVKDEASAKAAVPAIQAAMKDVENFEAQMKGFKDVPMEQMAKAQATVMNAMMEMGTKFEALQKRNPAAAKIIDTEMDKVMK